MNVIFQYYICDTRCSLKHQSNLHWVFIRRAWRAWSLYNGRRRHKNIYRCHSVYYYGLSLCLDNVFSGNTDTHIHTSLPQNVLFKNVKVWKCLTSIMCQPSVWDLNKYLRLRLRLNWHIISKVQKFTHRM